MKRANHTVAAALIFVALVFAAGADREKAKISSGEIQTGKVIIIGDLGSPLGTFFTIEGHRVDGPKYGNQTLKVDAINDQKTDKNILLVTRNLDLDPGKEYRVRGYESGEMTGDPEDKQDTRTGRTQQGYGFRSSFVVTNASADAKASPAAAVAANVRQVPAGDLLSGNVILIGSLGNPLGRYVTIEGTKPAKALMMANPMEIDAVDGKVLAAPILMEIHGAAGLPEGTRCILHGYETGALVSTPDDPAVKGAPAPQASYRFAVWFEVTEIKSPETLKKAPIR